MSTPKQLQTAAKYGILPWVCVLVMIIANLNGANIPWVLVFLPILLVIVVLLLMFVGMGILALILRKITRKAEK